MQMKDSFLRKQWRVGNFDSEGDFTLSGAAVKKMGASRDYLEAHWKKL